MTGSPKATMLRAVGLGTLLGAVWGVFLRVWMRLLVQYGEFSWGGTLLIVGLSALAGLGLGLVSGARRTGRGPLWRLAALLALPLVIFPQGIAFLLPALLFGGLALSGRPARWLRIVLGGLALAPLALVVLLPDPEPLGMPLPIVLVVLVTLLTVLARAAADLFRRWPQRAIETEAEAPAEAAEASFAG